MKKYNRPEIEMIVLQSADCITFDSATYGNKMDSIDFEDFFGEQGE